MAENERGQKEEYQRRKQRDLISKGRGENQFMVDIFCQFLALLFLKKDLFLLT